jgi:choline kinase
LFNCDVLFHADVVDRLAQAPGSAIAVDTRAPRATGEMNVRTDERGRVTAIGKHLDPQSAQGVSVQLVRFNAAGSASVRSEVERLIRDEPDAFPTSAYGPMIDSGGLSAVDVGELPWAEIDTVEDYEQAERRVAPRLFRVRQAGS